MKKDFKYMIQGGIIDYFILSLTKEQLIKNIVKENRAMGDVNPEYTIDIVNLNYEFMESTIKIQTGEKPFIIRYFGIPDFDRLDMIECGIAKISDNGSTFVFSDRKDILEFIGDLTGYSNDIIQLNK